MFHVNIRISFTLLVNFANTFTRISHLQNEMMQELTRKRDRLLHRENIRKCGEPRFWIIGACSIMLMFTITFLTLGRIEPSLTNPYGRENTSIHVDCGNNTHKAREMSCHYDIMAIAWIPEPCYQSAIANRYLDMYAWKFYAGPDNESEIPFEAIKNGDYTHMWTSNLFHVAHCLYARERYLAAVYNGLPIDSQAKVTHYASDCTMFSVNEIITREAVQTEVEVVYLSCSAKWWKV